MSLVSLGDCPVSTPYAKRQKLVSPFDNDSRIELALNRGEIGT